LIKLNIKQVNHRNKYNISTEFLTVVGEQWFMLTIHERLGHIERCKPSHGTKLAFLPARRYASAGLCKSNVSVRPSVCLSRAGIVSKRRKLAS